MEQCGVAYVLARRGMRRSHREVIALDGKYIIRIRQFDGSRVSTHYNLCGNVRCKKRSHLLAVPVP